MRKILKRLGIAPGVGAALVTAAGSWLWAAQSWAPPIALVEPGPGGIAIRRTELVGNFCAGAGNRPHPAILLLGGSEGGLSARADGWSRTISSLKQALANRTEGDVR